MRNPAVTDDSRGYLFMFYNRKMPLLDGRSHKIFRGIIRGLAFALITNSPVFFNISYNLRSGFIIFFDLNAWLNNYRHGFVLLSANYQTVFSRNTLIIRS